MIEFYVGQKVVCVDDRNCPNRTWLADAPKQGQPYTVERFGALSPTDGTQTLVLREIKNERAFDYAYRTYRFRPLESKAISLFRKIAADATSKRKITVCEPDRLRQSSREVG